MSRTDCQRFLNLSILGYVNPHDIAPPKIEAKEWGGARGSNLLTGGGHIWKRSIRCSRCFRRGF